MAKEKMNVTVSVDEQPYAVPQNWRWVRFGSIVSEMADGPFGSNLKTEHYTTQKEVRIIQLSNIGEEGWKEENTKYTTFEHVKTIERSVVQPGDIVIAKMMPAGRAIICPDKEEMYVLSSDAVKVVPSPNIYSLFMAKAINSPYFQNQVRGNTQGITRARTSIGKLKNYVFALPPVPEQKRIADRIESLFAKLDEAKEKAQAVVDGYEDRKAAILHQAFTGELTAEWRKKNNIVPENYVEKSKYLRDEEMLSKKQKKLKYSYPDDIILPQIPNEWQYAQIGDVSWSIKDGPHFSPAYVSEGIPFITGGNVRPEGVDFANAKRITKELHNELSKRCHPEKGDMLYTKGGTTGVARVNTYDNEFSVWVHVAVIKYVNTVLPEYFQLALNSPLCYEQSQKYTHGVGNQDLGLTRMINIVFPLCSIDEQKEIISTAGLCIEKEQKAKEAAEQVISQINIMKKAILARAFRGELGTNDPSEPPADIGIS